MISYLRGGCWWTGRLDVVSSENDAADLVVITRPGTPQKGHFPRDVYRVGPERSRAVRQVSARSREMPAARPRVRRMDEKDDSRRRRSCAYRSAARYDGWRPSDHRTRRPGALRSRSRSAVGGTCSTVARVRRWMVNGWKRHEQQNKRIVRLITYRHNAYVLCLSLPLLTLQTRILKDNCIL